MGRGQSFFKQQPRKQHGKENKFTFILKTNISPSGGRLEGGRLVVDFHSCPAEFHAPPFLGRAVRFVGWAGLCQHTVPVAMVRATSCSSSSSSLVIRYIICFSAGSTSSTWVVEVNHARDVRNEIMFVEESAKDCLPEKRLFELL